MGQCSPAQKGSGGGAVVLRSRDPLGPYANHVGEWLERWAEATPDRWFLAQRDETREWVGCTYAEAWRAASGIGTALRELGFGSDRPLLVLSENSINHQLMTLGAMLGGVLVAPISVAYSLQSTDFARLRAIAGLLRPRGLYAEDAERFAAATDALGDDMVVLSGADAVSLASATPEHVPVRPDSVAKVLFTSGSTGVPREVLTTHRMLCANQRMMQQVWPFLAHEPPVLLDWLPWSHTFGGSHNVGMVLANGGTLYIDGGRPAPGLINTTIENYRSLQPTLAFNVPAGWAQLAPILEQDRDFAASFFARLRVLFNASAALHCQTDAR